MSGRTSEAVTAELDMKSIGNRQTGSKLDPISGPSADVMTLHGVQSAGTPSAPYDPSHRAKNKASQHLKNIHMMRVSTQGSAFDPSLPDIQAEIKNFEAFSKAHLSNSSAEHLGGEYYNTVNQSPQEMVERVSGYPNPKLYD